MKIWITNTLRDFLYGVVRMTPDKFERQEGLWAIGEIIVLERFGNGITRQVGTEIKLHKLGYHYDEVETLADAVNLSERWIRLWKDNQLPHTDRSTGQEPHGKPGPKRKKKEKLRKEAADGEWFRQAKQRARTDQSEVDN